jgi:hypothetical protein
LRAGDVECAPVEGEGLGEPGQAVLGHGVWGGARTRRVRRQGTVVDYPTWGHGLN